MADQELKPCPFCGSSDIRVSALRFECGNCDAAGPTEAKKANWWDRRTTDHVNNFWNQRVAGIADRDAEITRLREALEFYAAPETWGAFLTWSKTLSGFDDTVRVTVSGVPCLVGGKRARGALEPKVPNDA